jgi:hypothetical protein
MAGLSLGLAGGLPVAPDGATGNESNGQREEQKDRRLVGGHFLSLVWMM